MFVSFFLHLVPVDYRGRGICSSSVPGRQRSLRASLNHPLMHVRTTATQTVFARVPRNGRYGAVMKNVVRNCILYFVLCVASAATRGAVPPTSANQAVIESDPMTQEFLRRVLVSGSDFSYPDAAAKQKQGGTCSCIMFLQPDGTVKSIALYKSSGHPILDNYVGRTLKGYRFKPGTKGPIRWFITFSWPGKIRVVGGKFSHD